MNTITIELCAEDRARLDNILEALKNAAVLPCIAEEAVEPLKVTPQETTEPAEEPLPFAPEPKKPAKAKPAPEAEPAPAPEPAPAETVPEVTAAELQSKVVNLVHAGKKDEARAIITEYAANVSAIPAEKRAEVLARLNELEG